MKESAVLTTELYYGDASEGGGHGPQNSYGRWDQHVRGDEGEHLVNEWRSDRDSFLGGVGDIRGISGNQHLVDAGSRGHMQEAIPLQRCDAELSARNVFSSVGKFLTKFLLQ